MKINNENTACQTARMRTRSTIAIVAESAGVSIDGPPEQRSPRVA